MAKTVFILGAGASVEAGAPLMNNFLDTIKIIEEGRGKPIKKSKKTTSNI